MKVNQMKEEDKQKKQLLKEIKNLQKRIIELEKLKDDSKRLEEALKGSEENWRSLVENTPDIIITVDREGTILFINRTVPGLIPEQIIGTSVYDYVPPEHHNILKKSLERVFKTGEPDSYELVGLGPHGSTSWYGSRVGPIKRDGKIVAVTLITSDITDRKCAEMTLSESEQRYRELFEGINDAVMVYSSKGKFLDCNEETVKRLGYSYKELLNLSAAEIVHPDFHQLMKENQKKIWAGKIITVESAQCCKDGRIIPVEVNARKIEYKGESVILAVVRDITDRKRAEDAQRESEKHFREVFEHSQDVLYKRNLITGQYEYMSPAITKITGYTPDEVMAMSNNEINAHIHPDDIKRVNNLRRNILKNPQDHKMISPVEYRVKCKDGSYRWISDHFALVMDPNGHSLFSVATLRDITEHKQLEETYQTLVENSLQGIAIIQDGRIVFANPACSDISGYSLDELLSLSSEEIKSVIYPEDRERFFKIWRDRLAGKQVSPYHEFRFIRKDGTVVWIEKLESRIEYQGKSAVQVAFMDISRRKHMEKASQESEEKFRSISEESFDIIFTIDREENFTYASPALKRILNYSPEEVLGKPLKNYLPEWELSKIQQTFIQLMKGEHIKGLKLDFISKNKSIIFLEINATPLFKNGKIVGYQGIARDITERKSIEEEIKKKLMKFRLEEGKLYLVEETTPTLSLELFKELLNVGYNGVIISRTPKKDFKKLIECDFDFLWLSEKGDENTLTPNLNKIEHRIESFPNRKIILFDRLDYLISKHGFKKVLTFVQSLRELAIISNYLIILSFDSLTLSNQELLLLKKETFEVELLSKPKLPESLLDVLKFIYEQNNIGIKPSYIDIGRELGLSQPTVRNRIRFLISNLYLIESLKGKKKLVELTERGKGVF